MTNPFTQTPCSTTHLQQQRRERFKLSVYATLGGLALLLCILLIQGCHAGRAAQARTAQTQVGIGEGAVGQ